MSATTCFSLQATSDSSGLYQGPLAADLLRQAPTLGSEELAVSLIHLAFDSLRPLDWTACSSLQATSESSGSSQHPLAAVLLRQAPSQGLRFSGVFDHSSDFVSRLRIRLRRPHHKFSVAVIRPRNFGLHATPDCFQAQSAPPGHHSRLPAYSNVFVAFQRRVSPHGSAWRSGPSAIYGPRKTAALRASATPVSKVRDSTSQAKRSLRPFWSRDDEGRLWSPHSPTCCGLQATPTCALSGASTLTLVEALCLAAEVCILCRTPGPVKHLV